MFSEKQLIFIRKGHVICQYSLWPRNKRKFHEKRVFPVVNAESFLGK